jgi:5'-methylthioadenosine phosphorylase
MTNLPEARLSTEAGICYSSIAMVTDFDCWHPDHDNVSVDQIINTLKKNTNKANSLINEITKEKMLTCSEKIKEASRKSMISDYSNVKKSTKTKLKYILNL